MVLPYLSVQCDSVLHTVMSSSSSSSSSRLVVAVVCSLKVDALEKLEDISFELEISLFQLPYMDFYINIIC